MGLLLQNDLEIHRHYFEEALDYFGIDAMYYQVKDGSQHYTVEGEQSSNYYDPTPIKLIFDQVPKVGTLKKLGWVTELTSDAQPIIHIPFDTPGIQVGVLFKVMDPLNQKQGKYFRATKMTTGIIYPSAVTMQIVAVIGDDPEETLRPYEGNKTIFIDNQENNDDIY